MSITTFFGWSKPDNRADRDLWGIKLNALFDDIDTSLNNISVASVASPIGQVTPYAGDTAPTGYLIADGSAISRTTYSALFAKIGIFHGQGDGSTTFNLPDARGKHFRYVDDGAGNDPDAATRTAGGTGGNTGDNVGSVQDDAFQGHDIRVADGGVEVQLFAGVKSGGASGSYSATAGSFWGAYSDSVIVADGVNGTPKTASQTRPINLYMTPIIKY